MSDAGCIRRLVEIDSAYRWRDGRILRLCVCLCQTVRNKPKDGAAAAAAGPNIE